MSNGLIDLRDYRPNRNRPRNGCRTALERSLPPIGPLRLDTGRYFPAECLKSLAQVKVAKKRS